VQVITPQHAKRRYVHGVRTMRTISWICKGNDSRSSGDIGGGGGHAKRDDGGQTSDRTTSAMYAQKIVIN